MKTVVCSYRICSSLATNYLDKLILSTEVLPDIITNEPRPPYDRRT